MMLSSVVFPHMLISYQQGFLINTTFLEEGTDFQHCQLIGDPQAVLEGKFRLIKEMMWKSWCYYGPNISSLECRQKHDLFQQRGEQRSFNVIILCKSFQQNFLRKICCMPENECFLLECVSKKYLLRMKPSFKALTYIKNKKQLCERYPGELFRR